MQRALIIQTAFIGDVILATSLIENLAKDNPHLRLDFLLRKGNENILSNNPHINKVYIWEKNENKYKGLFSILSEIRSNEYDYIFNLQRFFSTGFITALSKAKFKIGFAKNPLSMFYDSKVEHKIGNREHEVDRNHKLIESIVQSKAVSPKVYPSDSDYKMISEYNEDNFITIAPSSVWFTKQYPRLKWVEFLNEVPDIYKIYLLGSPSDYNFLEDIISESTNDNIYNLAGKLSLLQSAALMEKATMNYVNDSAPLHLASATNSPVSAIFCSTVPNFGFGPLSDNSNIIEIKEDLECRPCGLHGKKKCPKGHFKCGEKIDTESLLSNIDIVV